MKTYYVNDENFKQSEEYNEFLEQNPGIGYLRIRAYTASEAIPMNGLNVEVSKEIFGSKVIFFEGITDASGVTERIALPASKTQSDNLVAPVPTIYDVKVSSQMQNINSVYSIKIYDGICVAQNINITPNSQVGGL